MQRAWLAKAVVVLALIGCGDDDGDDDVGPDTGTASDGGRDAGPSGMDGGGADGGSIDAGRDSGSSLDASVESFSLLYNEVIQPRCQACHSALDGGRMSGNLALVPKNTAHMQLINQRAAGAACGDAGFTRVVPNSPNTSLFLRKVEPNPPCGARMPRAADAAVANYLSDSDIERIRRWIAQGALNN